MRNVDDVRKQRLALGYSVPMLAEVLRVEPRTVAAWESGAAEIPDWLMASLNALSRSQARRDELEMLDSDGTFTSRRRMLMLSKPVGFGR